MAFTVASEKSVLGNKRVVFLTITADGAEAEIVTGLDVIDAFSVGVQSYSSSSQAIKINEDSSGVAANGTLGISGVASGDEFVVICYGK